MGNDEGKIASLEKKRSIFVTLSLREEENYYVRVAYRLVPSRCLCVFGVREDCG